ncbi:type IV conjugative transfer system pilin TraA [Pantoea allii]|jgi:type IV conjugative transfer system pilin TraA|uniref:Pilin n=1 Tax=Pantoea allii TaxID=574096 RepID=A0ABS6VJG5_9GAMM|nr:MULTISPECIES: type IV conjugative transfer system pilin TraA [Pantoea]MBW1215803.1 conjugal transfer protein TraA [Pantoea allii]MBW1254626.1 conjugal transfer protein TraA [Pantoea allii]MBW1259453.1 conjugal transfer protein TraA [Pantoea allii]MBW1263714.1 conjugal transfer protein TraA [Pantoea allii]MBW1268501.1 conjugal transfer protein TraA [Pantoea allii]
MKVATSGSALTEGAAEACPTFSEAPLTVLTVMASRGFSYLRQHRANAILVCMAILVFALPHIGHATDLLAGQKQDAKDTFGHGSTVEWGIYICEIILSAGLYMKTRNPMHFVGGLAFLIVITKTFFALAG